jgi:hypothetical protein
MFPEYAPLLQNDTSETTSIGKSFLFDFAAGDFVIKDGKLQSIEGVNALKTRIEKLFKTEKFKFKIYDTGQSDEYGMTLLELVNSGFPQPYIQSEIQREITEALTNDPEIISIDGFNFSRDRRMLAADINIITIYGPISQEVRF